MGLPPFVGGWYLSISQVYGVFTHVAGGLLDLIEHYLLVVTYPGMIGQFFEFLEELVAFLVGRLPELLPLHVLYLCIRILPEPCIEFIFEVFIGGVLLFSIGVPPYKPGTQLPPCLSIITESQDTEDDFVGMVTEVLVE